ncbi:hypothetical protein B0T21DRAFT_163600 [Apiosordaria backusii]|uniref:Uncharacterized protein n=1 Tax=Apiosordaria backusii TaxID=314023 RepID=A0AA40BNC1_9PEZI|nr:hypothetical protein B0T21DRAFT_163600 [Apiosordaria backusii]
MGWSDSGTGRTHKHTNTQQTNKQNQECKKAHEELEFFPNFAFFSSCLFVFSCCSHHTTTRTVSLDSLLLAVGEGNGEIIGEIDRFFSFWGNKKEMLFVLVTRAASFLSLLIFCPVRMYVLSNVAKALSLSTANRKIMKGKFLFNANGSILYTDREHRSHREPFSPSWSNIINVLQSPQDDACVPATNIYQYLAGTFLSRQIFPTLPPHPLPILPQVSEQK